jgi:hypothetical protein
MSGRHTPGPWFAVARMVEVGDDSADICSTNPHTFSQGQLPRPIKEQEANARLIARAPDMLALLQEVAEYLDSYADVVDGDDGQPEANDAMRLLTDVNAVISQAGGDA